MQVSSHALRRLQWRARRGAIWTGVVAAAVQTSAHGNSSAPASSAPPPATSAAAAAATPAAAKLAALHGAAESRAAPLKELDWVTARLDWMADKSIWPWGKGVRYTWTDAFGVVLLVSLYSHTGDAKWLQQAEAVAADVWKVLGDARCLRIGLEPFEDRFPYSYAHYNAMWLYALHCLHKAHPGGGHRDRAIAMVKSTHPCFVVPGRGAWCRRLAAQLGGRCLFLAWFLAAAA